MSKQELKRLRVQADALPDGQSLSNAALRKRLEQRGAEVVARQTAGYEPLAGLSDVGVGPSPVLHKLSDGDVLARIKELRAQVRPPTPPPPPASGADTAVGRDILARAAKKQTRPTTTRGRGLLAGITDPVNPETPEEQRRRLLREERERRLAAQIGPEIEREVARRERLARQYGGA